MDGNEISGAVPQSEVIFTSAAAGKVRELLDIKKRLGLDDPRIDASGAVTCALAGGIHHTAPDREAAAAIAAADPGAGEMLLAARSFHAQIAAALGVPDPSSVEGGGGALPEKSGVVEIAPGDRRRGRRLAIGRDFPLGHHIH